MQVTLMIVDRRWIVRALGLFFFSSAFFPFLFGKLGFTGKGSAFSFSHVASDSNVNSSQYSNKLTRSYFLFLFFFFFFCLIYPLWFVFGALVQPSLFFHLIDLSYIPHTNFFYFLFVVICGY